MDMQGINPQDLNQMAQMKQIEEMKKKIMSRILTKDAFERLGRVRTVNPNLASSVELYILQLQQAGQLRGQVNEEELKNMLKVLSKSGSKDFSIKRK